jgi:hypothetical protein
VRNAIAETCKDEKQIHMIMLGLCSILLRLCDRMAFKQIRRFDFNDFGIAGLDDLARNIATKEWSFWGKPMSASPFQLHRFIEVR